MYLKFLAVLTMFLTGVTALAFLSMTALVCLQVFYRYVLNSPLTGSEEAARALLIYIVMLGSAVAVGNRAHMAIRYFYEKFPRLLQKMAAFIYFASILFIASLFIIKGNDLAQRTMMQTTPALQIPKGLIIYAFPIGGVLMFLYALAPMLQLLFVSKDAPPSVVQDPLQ